MMVLKLILGAVLVGFLYKVFQEVKRSPKPMTGDDRDQDVILPLHSGHGTEMIPLDHDPDGDDGEEEYHDE